MVSTSKLRGLVAQNVGGRKSMVGALLQLLGVTLVSASGATGVITAPRNCIALIYLKGPGGSGGANGSGATGAGGGAALFKLVRMTATQALNYALGVVGAGVVATSDGNDATDSTVTLPNGQVLTAGGGKKGLQLFTAPGGKGGVATGGDINRNGADGGTGNGGVNGQSAAPGGGAGGAGSGGGNLGGGGAQAGFGDIATLLAGGNGGQAGGGSPGEGGGSGAHSGNSADGGAPKLFVLLIRSF